MTMPPGTDVPIVTSVPEQCLVKGKMSRGGTLALVPPLPSTAPLSQPFRVVACHSEWQPEKSIWLF